jgi:hypothetical protein
MLGGEPGEREAVAEIMSVWQGELLGVSDGDAISVWQGELLGDSDGDMLWQGVSEAVGVWLALLDGEGARDFVLLGLAARVRVAEDEGLAGREWLGLELGLAGADLLMLAVREGVPVWEEEPVRLELGVAGRLLELLGVFEGEAAELLELEAVSDAEEVCNANARVMMGTATNKELIESVAER